jgi:hypothetical protein
MATLSHFKREEPELKVPLLVSLHVSREPRKKKIKVRPDCSSAPTQLALCLQFASMYKAESWQRAVNLDDSTPQ